MSTRAAIATAPGSSDLVVRGAVASAVDVLTLVAAPQTERTYRRACRRLVDWLGPLAGPEDLTAANVAAYHAQLVAGV